MQHMSGDQRLLQYGSSLKEQHSHVDSTKNILSEWTPSSVHKFFNLATVNKQDWYFRRKVDDEFTYQVSQAQVDGLLFKKSVIELEKIFAAAQGGDCGIILITGPPGSGKTTLSTYIWQSWGRGELFQEFTAVVLLRLRDPAVQNAQTIADLLPCRDKDLSVQVAKAITDVDGRGVLWILDSWDELPPRLREESFLKDVITRPDKNRIGHSSMITTSRPEYLESLGSLQLDLLGLTKVQQRQYFTECLKGDIKAVDTLLEKLEAAPAIEEGCHLPLNASLVACCYQSDGSLPVTVQSVFSSFVDHCLSRLLYERLGRTAQVSLQSQLPEEIQAPFDQLCKLAFTGIEENRVMFSNSELEAVKDLAVLCEVGLLQVVPSISGAVYYSFIHSSLQVFMAALHLSRLPAGRQISTFESLFGNARFLAVLKFYAAITKLRTSRPFLNKLPHWLSPVPSSLQEFIRKIIKKQQADAKSYQSKHLLVFLLHCLYAAQDSSLCQFVAERLNFTLDVCEQGWLTSADCLAVGYFLSAVSITVCSDLDQFFTVELEMCALGDIGTRSLMHGMCNGVDPHSEVLTRLCIALAKNGIQEAGASSIARVLKDTSIVRGLDLHDNPIGDSGLSMLFDSLKHNSTLDFLDVAGCHMTDAGVASLADALNVNTALKTLHIEDNDEITENGLTCLVEVLSKKSGLECLILPRHLPVDGVTGTINDARERNGLPIIAKHLGE